MPLQLTYSNQNTFPAFRNAINEGAGSYYDIPVGTALVGVWDQWESREQPLAKACYQSGRK